MFLQFIIAMAIAVLAIVLAVILGDYGPWYLSWLLGTGFMILVATSAGVLFEAQEDAATRPAAGDPDVASVVLGVRADERPR